MSDRYSSAAEVERAVGIMALLAVAVLVLIMGVLLVVFAGDRVGAILDAIRELAVR